MQDQYRELLEILKEAADEIGSFKVTAYREDSAEGSPSEAIALPVIKVIVDESDGEICCVRGQGTSDDVQLTLADLYEKLNEGLKAYPEYNLCVSEWFELEGGYTVRVDMALKGFDVDEDEELFRLLF